MIFFSHLFCEESWVVRKAFLAEKVHGFVNLNINFHEMHYFPYVAVLFCFIIKSMQILAGNSRFGQLLDFLKCSE